MRLYSPPRFTISFDSRDGHVLKRVCSQCHCHSPSFGLRRSTTIEFQLSPAASEVYVVIAKLYLDNPKDIMLPSYSTTPSMGHDDFFICMLYDSF